MDPVKAGNPNLTWVPQAGRDERYNERIQNKTTSARTRGEEHKHYQCSHKIKIQNPLTTLLAEGTKSIGRIVGLKKLYKIGLSMSNTRIIELVNL